MTELESSPSVARLLATAVTNPSFESAAASALVAELLDFAAAYRLDYATALVAESESTSPPFVGGECALGTDVLEDRQEDFEYLAAAVPRFASILLARDGDPDAPDIPTPRSYAEEITGLQNSFPAGQPARGHLAAPPTWLHWEVSCKYPVEPPRASLRSSPGTSRVARHTEDYNCGSWVCSFYYGPVAVSTHRHVAASVLHPSVVLRFGFQFSSPQPTPLSTSHSLSAPPSDEHRKVHWDAAKRVLRYLCSTSSYEAEIYAGAMAAQELRWLTYLLTDLGEQPHSPPVLYVGNKAMIALCQEHRLEHRTKHIALRYFLAQELQQRGQLRLVYVATRANTADIFTKALPLGYHQCFSTVLGLVRTLPHLLTALLGLYCVLYLNLHACTR
ncbi:unnamed protein product [Closterium sp. NIES-54]